MKINIVKKDDIGQVDHGWLKSNHYFSFGHYHDPQRMNFGALRVINHDWVEPGAGFGKHPHDNMEIISIPLSGKLKHRDSMGNEKEIVSGEVQAMSAGTGVIHSEMNGSEEAPVEFLQIWITTRNRGIKPNYSQMKFAPEDRQNKWQIIVSPEKNETETVKIHQDAWMSLGKFKKDSKTTYKLKDDKNGLALLLISGKATITDHQLEKDDLAEITTSKNLEIEFKEDSEILAMEVPM